MLTRCKNQCTSTVWNYFIGNVRYSRRVFEYSPRYSPSTRVANYSDSTALASSLAPQTQKPNFAHACPPRTKSWWRHCVFTHPVATLFSLKWRHHETATLTRKSDSVSRCVFAWRTVLQNFNPIRLKDGARLCWRRDGRPNKNEKKKNNE